STRFLSCVAFRDAAGDVHPYTAGEQRSYADTCVRGHRESDTQRPFDLVVGGASPADPAKARDVIGPLHDAGATWWDERQLDPSPDVDCLAPGLRRIEAGPPVLG
ncbi:LLM class flavin-dependent oxidoreductase, partial [Streptomyces sp. NPDC091416]